MKISTLKPHKRLFSGVKALAVLASTLAPTAAVYAGQLSPEEEKDKNVSKPLPAGVDAEGMERKSSKVSALWVQRGDTLCSQKNYTEALEFYEKANGRGVSGAPEKLTKALDKVVLEGNGWHASGRVTEALDLYAQAARYGNEDGKELVAELGVEAGDIYAAKRNHEKALKCYEQAVLYGSEEAKRKQPEARRIAEAERLRLAPTSWLKSKDEDVFQRFLKGLLVYRQDPKSDVGKIELRIADLANLLE